MRQERWREVEELFESALERRPEDRAAFLDQACGTDAELRREIESLLSADAGATGYLEPDGRLPPLLQPDLLPRLQAALGDRYVLDRELGGGGHEPRLRGRGDHPRPPGGRQSARAVARRGAGHRAVPARDPDRRESPAPPHRPGALGGRGRRPPLLHHAVRGGRVPPAAHRPGRRRSPSPKRCDSCARSPTRWSTPTGGASSIATSSPPTSSSKHGHALIIDFGIAKALSAAAEGPHAERGRDVDRHWCWARRPTWRRSRRRETRSTTAWTSTRWDASPTSC